jgi:hypothetical protein
METYEIDTIVEKEIKRRNKLFKKATKAQKRVLVAKDVINQLKKGKFKAIDGVFGDIDYTSEGDLSARDEFLKGEITCQACALGAMFMSCTLFNNNLSLRENNYAFPDIGDGVKKGLDYKNGFNKLFAKPQLRLIEIAFEQGRGYFSIKSNLETKAGRFGSLYTENKERLTKIMTNIIKNNGTFKP